MALKDTAASYHKDLLAMRLQAYEDLWQRLQHLARYDRPLPLNANTLRELTLSMRDWYFEKGGMFLSEDARPAYFRLKEEIENLLDLYKDQPEKTLTPTDQERILQQASALRTSLTRDLGTRQSTFASVAKADPSNIQQVAASQLELINDYYASILQQANQSFRWAIIAAAAGLLFFAAAVGFLLVSGNRDLSTISVISGALIEVISGINFYLYNKALGQAESFHTRLERTVRFLLANSVSENLKGELQQSARLELVRTIAGITPAAAVSPPPAPASEVEAG